MNKEIQQAIKDAEEKHGFTLSNPERIIYAEGFIAGIKYCLGKAK